jgi:molybdopterin-guanine dinucleotide biosynthesis protein A
MTADAVRTPIAAAILAGGQARRLAGANKAALHLGDRRIVDRQFAVLRDVASTVFVVGGNPGPWREYGVAVVADEIPGKGALGGIYTAIVASPCERTLVVGCDMPFLSGAFLRHLADVAGADLVIPRSSRGYEPLCAVYAKTCAAGIRARIESGALEASVLPDDVRVAEIGPEVLAAYDPDGLLFVNVNTPHDYERARWLLELKPKPTEDRITTETTED